MNLLNQLDVLTGNPFLLFILLFAFAFLNVFFPPIPLEGATLFGGYLAGTRRVSLVVIIGAATAGMFLGSLLLYAMLKRYGVAFLERTPLRHAFSETAQRRAAEWLSKFGLWAAFIAKFIPGMSLVLVISFGTLRVERRRAVSVIFFSNLLYYTLLAVIGNFLGAHWGNALKWLNTLSRFWIVLLLLVLGYGIFRTITRRKCKNPPKP